MRLRRVKAYAGVDPTARSLHLGHMVAFMPLFWMYLHGYGAFTLIGTSTAKIGDPTGRTESRPQLASADVVQNLASMQFQLKAIWQNVEITGTKRFNYTKDWSWQRGIYNNNTWWNKQPMLEVMKRLGMFVRLGPMLGRDNVKTRLDSGAGMSFSEFAYPLMQGWDWFELYTQRGVQMQIGGSDQYGNILMGTECVKHCVNSESQETLKLPMGKLDQLIGFTVPLLTDASGAKFGKSAGNAIWLDPFMTTPYDMYGYLVRRRDDEVERLLKLLTFHPQQVITEVMTRHNQDPPQRVAQHLLAYEVVSLIHGNDVADSTSQEHKAMYGAKSKGAPTAQSPEQYHTPEGQVNLRNRPRADIKLPMSILQSSIARILFASGLASSISDGDRSVKAGGIYLGGSPSSVDIKYQYGMIPEQLQWTPIRTWDPAWNTKFLIEGKLLLIRKGKHNMRCVELISDQEFAKLKLTYPGQPYTGKFRAVVDKLNKAGEAARAKKQQAQGGELSEEAQVAWASKAETSEGQDMHLINLRKIRHNVDRLKEEGLVKEEKDPHEWP